MSQKSIHQAMMQKIGERVPRNAAQRAAKIQRLRRYVAFDAFLARVAEVDHQISLKGGYALAIFSRLSSDQKNLPPASRPTKDIDFVARDRSGVDESRYLQDVFASICAVDRGDDFSFSQRAEPKTMAGSGKLTLRFLVSASLAGGFWESFDVDISLADVYPDPPKRLKISPGVLVETVPMAQMMAEKMHALTLDRGDFVNSRVKDLVDLSQMIINRSVNPDHAREALNVVFKERATHPLPRELGDEYFPSFWKKKFELMASELDLELSFNQAVALVKDFYLTVIEGHKLKGGAAKNKTRPRQ